MRVFIDGQAGTTGLQLKKRLESRGDCTILEIDPARFDDPAAKKPLMAQADVVFLCLPDDAARESAGIAPPGTLVIDASTAHRTAPGWVYGFPELSPAHRQAVATGKRIAVTGCHAAGFISMAYPLRQAGAFSRGQRLSLTSLTGYTGGGLALIEAYETGRKGTPRAEDDPLCAPRPYALGLEHKHLAEIAQVCDLEAPPIFYPVVGDMPQGMLVTVPVWPCQCEGKWKTATPQDFWEALATHYADSHFVRVMPFNPANDGAFMDPTACNNTNRLEIFVFGNSHQILLAARLDNLGKGASGAALQCMNIALGLDERIGLA